MKKEITFTEFCDEFAEVNRENSFSYEGKKAIFEYMESYELETGEAQELDIIALCGEFDEYQTATEAAEQLFGFEPEDEEEETEDEAMDFLEDRASVIDFDGGVIIYNY